MKGVAIFVSVVIIILLVIQFVFGKPVFQEIFGAVEKIFNHISDVINAS